MAVIGRFRNVIKKRFLGIIKKRFNQKMMMVRNMKNWQSPRVRGPVEVLFSQEYLSVNLFYLPTSRYKTTTEKICRHLVLDRISLKILPARRG